MELNGIIFEIVYVFGICFWDFKSEKVVSYSLNYKN